MRESLAIKLGRLQGKVPTYQLQTFGQCFEIICRGIAVLRVIGTEAQALAVSKLDIPELRDLRFEPCTIRRAG